MTKAGFWRRWFAVVIDSIFSLAIFFIIYEPLLIAFWNGQTIGKKIMGIKVVMTDGSPVSLISAFVRSLSKLLSNLSLLIGYLWMLWDKDSQTWHDKLADTFVVEA